MATMQTVCTSSAKVSRAKVKSRRPGGEGVGGGWVWFVGVGWVDTKQNANEGLDMLCY